MQQFTGFISLFGIRIVGQELIKGTDFVLLFGITKSVLPFQGLNAVVKLRFRILIEIILASRYSLIQLIESITVQQFLHRAVEA